MELRPTCRQWSRKREGNEMKRWLLVGVMMAGWLGLPDCVRAQYGPYARPQYGPFQGAPGVSPYLNLALGTNIAGVTPGLNFLALTIPAFNQRAVNSVVGNDLNYLSRAIGQTASPAVPDGLFTPLPQTGHPVGFNTVG